jgi:GGDEF domain-containing protein
MVGTGADGAQMVVEKARARVEAIGRSLGYPAKLVTVSIEVAAYTTQEAHDEDTLVAADRAPYRAKASGRNRVANGES